jgi:hypothetical protein
MKKNDEGEEKNKEETQKNDPDTETQSISTLQLEKSEKFTSSDQEEQKELKFISFGDDCCIFGTKEQLVDYAKETMKILENWRAREKENLKIKNEE